MWQRYRETGECHLYKAYKWRLNRTRNEVEKAKRNFEKKLVSNIKKDPKSFFAYTRYTTRTKDSVGPFVDNEGNAITDTFEAANVLNDFFTSVFTDEGVGCLPELAKIFKRPWRMHYNRSTSLLIWY